MKDTVKTGKRRILLLWGALIAVFILLVLKGDRIKAAALDAMTFAALKLLPSLFLFSVFAKFAAGVPVLPSEKRIPWLSLPLSALPALFIGLFSGFPTGAIAAKDLLDEGHLSEPESFHLAMYADNASLAFVVFTVGDLLGGRQYGWALFAAGTLASLIVGALFADHTKHPFPLAVSINKKPLTARLAEAIVSASHAMLALVAFLTVFGVIAEEISSLSLPNHLTTALLLFLEPTAATRRLAAYPIAYALPLSGFALGFSGLSVMLQRLSVFDGSLSFRRLVGIRLLIGIFSAFSAFLFLKIL